MESINRTCDQITDSYIQKHINEKTYIMNLENVLFGCEEIKAFLKIRMEEVTRLLAISSLLAKSDTVLGKVIILTFKKKYPKNLDTLLEKELMKVRKDIEENKETSKKQIEEIQKNV